MNWQEYLQVFDQRIQHQPDNPYTEYIVLNKKRVARWMKTLQLKPELIAVAEAIRSPQNWIAITEPWCGDAAHNLPVFEKLAEYNKLITIDYILRDDHLTLMDQYLTNGKRNIPKVIARDESNSDLWTWGPEPDELHQLKAEWKETITMEDFKIETQKWYNTNKAQMIQDELIKRIKAIG